MVFYYRHMLIRLNTFIWSYYFQRFILFFRFFDDLLCWWMMFIVAHQNMVHQRTLRREKAYANF